ncbi:MAG: hypothetical protein A2186_00065 [Candidatus Levybacteria bacterium RIFOXYA1_FULL_41_10]|nr:MAG: serine-type D-Ala-D-Ala carboxypeptidase, D-alanyl-D-alanine carboxypeptidase (penicillin-binding protein 5/6) [Candidatus Levybacteria bacterium GW2011_GWC1_40_19]KKR94950.1 MAG: D-alanyl-D-alanine carboxypeptidase [Candidatus Levybacteria bacterium GW2011_GWA2_41_15]OGH27379.1 MAG: hypothetical protein A3D82_01615 [Candidatus Levybacteria bacterium RIFCSPHIGHO2_02_FULL_40_29]OGH50029.1 MAG: hypothetical protein A3J18_04010 [Candidatus Levybacteria bacterium RIFCSPLOWO2_02_FULL_40_18]O
MLRKLFPISLLAVLFVVFYFFYARSGEVQEKITSPVPLFLTLLENRQVSTLDIWSPSRGGVLSFSSGKPEISAQGALVYDLTEDEIVYEKDSDARYPMASLTKIMTAIVALEHKKENDRYYVYDSDIVGENSMGLTSGEVMHLEELLYGLILPSGNDAAEALASNYEGGRNAFIDAMNEKAEALGLTNTHFTNPSGLEGDGAQYTTAKDLLIITRYGLSNLSLFGKVVATVEKEIPGNSDHKYFYLYNDTNLLTSYPGVKGVKTGYTPEAGLCLVTYIDYGGHQIIGVLLGSQNRRQEMKDLLDYSLRLAGVEPPPHN